MTEIDIKIDESKCIHCGQCVKDCIAKVYELNENNSPEAKYAHRCISCQHCFSICPVGAISICGKEPEKSEKIYTQNPDMILNLIQSRRSFRQYKSENVDKEILKKLKNMLNWVPTGCNYHKLHFSFIDDLDTMNEFRKQANQKIINALTKTPKAAVAEKFEVYKKAMLDGEDVVFRGAPHMLVTANPIQAPCAKEDAVIALSYFELYAQSLGIGTCWCGFGQICLSLFPELCDYIKIPNGYKVGYVMLFGPKAVNYARITQPEDCSIISVSKSSFNGKISIINKLKRYFWNFIR